MKLSLLTLAVILWPFAVSAQDAHSDVYGCMENIDQTITWGECLNLTFSPCETHEIGKEPHLACLIDLRESWRTEMIETNTSALEKLDEKGNAELSGLMKAWPKFVQEKCDVVAQGRAHISAEAALLGCQISEMVLMANEFNACLNGNSKEPYCKSLTP